MDMNSPVEWKAAYNRAVAEVLRDRRVYLGVTYPQLVTATGLSLGTVQRLVKGEREITIGNLAAMAPVLKFASPGEITDQAEAAMAKTADGSDSQDRAM